MTTTTAAPPAATPEPDPIALVERRSARPASWRYTLLAAILLAVLLAADVILGPRDVRVTLPDLGRVLAVHVLRQPAPSTDHFADADAIIWEMRLPRAVVAALVGALLAYAGVALQGLLMNPLADPYVVGVSAGAAIGAAAGELLGLGALWLGFARIGLAFAGAVGAVLLVYALARVGGRVSVNTLLLAGVVVGTLLSSLIPLLLTVTHRMTDITKLLFYLIGMLSGADWSRAALLLPFLLVAAVCLRVWARELNIMTLGEETAAHLGVDVEAMRRRVLAVGALVTAAAVSVAGIIGFVGLVVPHLARRLVGPDHRAVLPLAALLGACLLVAADTVARVYLNELQVGVVTALVGAPMFCWLLRRRQAAW